MNHLPRLAALVLALTIAGAALAQPQDSTPPANPQGQAAHAPNPQQQLERLTKQLQLTADQQAKIGPILQQRDQQAQALRGDSNLTPADRRAKMMSLMQESNSQIDGLLTDPQRAQMKAVREKAMERMQDRRGQHQPSSSSSGG
jgi:protein CpxP